MDNRGGYLGLFISFIVISQLILGYLNRAYGAVNNFDETLQDELKAIATKHDILIKGLDKTREISARPLIQGSLQEQLQGLLINFNYVFIHAADSGIKEVLILSQKKAAPEIPDQIILNTTRKGNHHLVQVAVQGPNYASVGVSLLVDTGASLVVLPASIIPRLGFSSGQLENQKIQTANGLLDASIGQLNSLKIGAAIIYGVNAAFIADNLLGANGLLGMNVLGRYLVTINDQQNLITLSRQR
ncbi:A32 family peptidase [Candidatus Nitrosoglobus terrae]|uniref:A32 family peptidase n=1 Tax=Candidatus Nitrosoglobus terrae TaxID=1630141 RepID=A0A1Q2SM49_9GAMM|nr:retropepsin-like aspartic protease [Candidatus Nitrosoglobus terrae]BAW80218.1 A32 family peptidase [Candidatus Nitrosoglobus terrae]